MTEQSNPVIAKTHELEEELKRNGLWQNTTPAWVSAFDENSEIVVTDFAQWLQYIFIPNHLHPITTSTRNERKLIGPPALKYFGDSATQGKLLQLIIEIDSLL